MKNSKHSFKNSTVLTDRIQAYFVYIEGEYHLEKKPAKKSDSQSDLTDQKTWDREPEPATIAGLAFFLGFNSREEFEVYENSGKYAAAVK
jgi:hypothetical protein